MTICTTCAKLLLIYTLATLIMVKLFWPLSLFTGMLAVVSIFRMFDPNH
jgi:hypothetical protein